jgi:hypothetical protein
LEYEDTGDNLGMEGNGGAFEGGQSSEGAVVHGWMGGWVGGWVGGHITQACL